MPTHTYKPMDTTKVPTPKPVGRQTDEGVATRHPRVPVYVSTYFRVGREARWQRLPPTQADDRLSRRLEVDFLRAGTFTSEDPDRASPQQQYPTDARHLMTHQTHHDQTTYQHAKSNKSISPQRPIPDPSPNSIPSIHTSSIRTRFQSPIGILVSCRS